ncbi:unnamed protein product [Closterium sp. NIES-65]|nr:unnamed protein product [Closterium sp. NIES-65]
MLADKEDHPANTGSFKDKDNEQEDDMNSDLNSDVNSDLGFDSPDRPARFVNHSDRRVGARGKARLGGGPLPHQTAVHEGRGGWEARGGGGGGGSGVLGSRSCRNESDADLSIGFSSSGTGVAMLAGFQLKGVPKEQIGLLLEQQAERRLARAKDGGGSGAAAAVGAAAAGASGAVAGGGGGGVRKGRMGGSAGENDMQGSRPGGGIGPLQGHAIGVSSLKDHHRGTYPSLRPTDYIFEKPYEDLRTRYILHNKKLGSGQYGVIRRCLEISSGMQLACKTVKKAEIKSHEEAQDLRKEVATLSMLQGHPFIVRLHDTVEDRKGHPFIAWLHGTVDDGTMSGFESTPASTPLPTTTRAHGDGAVHSSGRQAVCAAGGGTAALPPPSLTTSLLLFPPLPLTNQHVHMVMELCTGGDLFDRVAKDGPYSAAAGARLCAQLVAVLLHCYCQLCPHSPPLPFLSPPPQQHVHMVMELCTGGDHFDRVTKDGPYSAAAGARLCAQLLAALLHCHQCSPLSLPPLTKQHVHMVMELCTGGDLFDRVAKDGPYSAAAGARLCAQLVAVLLHCYCQLCPHSPPLPFLSPPPQQHVHMVMELCTGGDHFDRVTKDGPYSAAAGARLCAQLLAALLHCHQCSPLSLPPLTKQHVHMVMELCTGGDLFDRVAKDGPYSAAAGARLCAQLVAALLHCHRHGIVHRDVKPENILLTSRQLNSDIKLVDFGIATFFQEGERLKELMGTPQYMAPELIQGEYGPEVDVWSAGVVMYIAMCGVPPFWASSNRSLAEAIRGKEVSFKSAKWAGVPEECKDLIGRMLDKDPKRRITALEILGHPWIHAISYSAERVVGNGSFGVVFQASCLETGETVAIKKVLQDKRYKNRELQIMRLLEHPNVVALRHCFFSTTDKDELYLNLVLEFVPETVYRITKHYTKMNQRMPLLYVKLYTYQICRALAYIHNGIGVCHRDIKPQNLLVNPHTHQLKLCDFGSAKVLVKGEPNISYICSRYYRAPELIFGATEYTTAIDIWSAGCVMAELLLGQPLFPGESGVDQLVEIIKVLGTPTREEIKCMNPNYTEFKFPQIKAHPWHKVFSKRVPAEAVDLVSRLLQYSPNLRCTAAEALVHPFFDEIKDPNTRLPNGKPLPPLFNFKKEEFKGVPIELVRRIVPEHTRRQNGHLLV